MLSEEKRNEYMKFLGYGDCSPENVKKLQADYFTRKRDIDGIYGPDTDILLQHVYNVKKFTKNFSPEEFKCECGGKYCTGYPDYMKKNQLKHLQTIRSHYGRPMYITCGLRCSRYNRSLPGSIPKSKHLYGRATDFYMRGVTDTVKNRKAAIRYIKGLPNHTYTYGHCTSSDGRNGSASYMGNALHTDTK